MFDSALWLPKDSAPVFIPGEAASGSGEVPAAAVPVLVSGAAASGSGDVPAPPVPREQRRRTGFRNPSWQVTGGHIVLDIGRDSLDAHCGNPAHDDEPGNPCRLNRKRLAHPSGRQLAQGRPLGEEFVWLELGAQMPSRQSHVDLLRPAGVNTSFFHRIVFSREPACSSPPQPGEPGSRETFYVRARPIHRRGRRTRRETVSPPCAFPLYGLELETLGRSQVKTACTSQ